MNPHSNGAGRVNSYALVTYIPDPFGSFLDQLRSELEPETLNPRAHVTILPPRPLPEGISQDTAWTWIRDCMAEEPPFLVSAGEVDVFPGTNVIHLSLRSGFEHLRCLHGGLNSRCLACQERFDYHPHITLAQNLTPERAAELATEARHRWQSYTGPRQFTARTLTFVQELTDRRWADLKEVSLRLQAALHR